MLTQILAQALAGQTLTAEQSLTLADCDDSNRLMITAGQMRDDHFQQVVTYSRKVFFPLTHLCRDVCHYCTFAQTPKFIEQAYMPLETVLEQARAAAQLGCKEALFTLGEKPELRYSAARKALDAMGFESTLHYVAHVAEAVFQQTGILPHINPGCMNRDEIAMLRKVSASMGIMLESASERLCEKGMPHYGSPDKQPAQRLQTLKLAGEVSVPMTSGILIGIGETRRERIESLLAIRQLHEKYGHIQEVIIQNFRAKPGTKMAQAPEPDLNELLWTIAVARIVMGGKMSIQAPPNLSPGVLEQIVAAGINDWGGVSPVTPDFVNPEAPWPHLDQLTQQTANAGKALYERLTIYPDYIKQRERWLDQNLHRKVLQLTDADGMPREDGWLSGYSQSIPNWAMHTAPASIAVSADIKAILARAGQGELMQPADIVRLFQARGADFDAVCRHADAQRQELCGDTVSFAINRNINYTNICYFKCSFCAFSKGKHSENLRGKPYDLDHAEIRRRTVEAWQRGATEVCMQGGIHPSYTGDSYSEICRAVKQAVPQMHIHAFSPLEVWQGAATLNLGLEAFLRQLKDAGLGTLPGTAAEILDDEVRATLCADKINTEQWLNVMRAAHKLDIRTTATIMFGHVDNYRHWANHLIHIRDLQRQTGGFTEFVPLPFVASEAPVYLKGHARQGPSLRECLLMHAVSRIVLSPFIENIQASWVKMGEAGVKLALKAGVNDLGGTLMNESITRAAGASHGQELAIDMLEAIIQDCGRKPMIRNTVYQPADPERVKAARRAAPLSDIILTDAQKPAEKPRLLKPGKSLDPRDVHELP